MGLGFDSNATKSELGAIRRLQDLKYQYKIKAEPEKAEHQPKDKFELREVGKNQLSKRITKTATDELIEQRDQRRLEKKQKKDLKQVEELETIVETEEATPDQPVEKKQYFLKRQLPKTRSKQKNRRRDKRDPDLLARKFGTVGEQLQIQSVNQRDGSDEIPS